MGPPAFALSIGAGGPGPHTRNERPAARQLPLRLCNMKDTTKLNITNESGDDQPDDPLSSYTPQQRKTIIKGLHILSRVAIRSYLRQQAERDHAKESDGEESQ